MYKLEEVTALFDRAIEATSEFTEMIDLMLDGKISLTDDELSAKYEEVSRIIQDSEDAAREFLSLFDQGTGETGV